MPAVYGYLFKWLLKMYFFTSCQLIPLTFKTVTYGLLDVNMIFIIYISKRSFSSLCGTTVGYYCKPRHDATAYTDKEKPSQACLSLFTPSPQADAGFCFAFIMFMLHGVLPPLIFIVNVESHVQNRYILR